jgi:histidine triad (HIT) family protein
MCLFCQIVNKEIQSEIVAENEKIVAFKDINPAAPIHVLIVPKKHISSIAALERDDLPLISEMIWFAKELAQKLGIAQSGYKLMFNSGKDAGQMIDHLHLHLIGGKKLERWPV